MANWRPPSTQAAHHARPYWEPSSLLFSTSSHQQLKLVRVGNDYNRELCQTISLHIILPFLWTCCLMCGLELTCRLSHFQPLQARILQAKQWRRRKLLNSWILSKQKKCQVVPWHPGRESIRVTLSRCYHSVFRSPQMQPSKKEKSSPKLTYPH